MHIPELQIELSVFILVAALIAILGRMPFRHWQCRLLRVSRTNVRDAIAHRFPGAHLEDPLIQSQPALWWLNMEYIICGIFNAFLYSILIFSISPGIFNFSIILLSALSPACMFWAGLRLAKAMTLRVVFTKSYIIWGDVRQEAPWDCRLRTDILWAHYAPRPDVLTIKLTDEKISFCGLSNGPEISSAAYAPQYYDSMARRIGRLFR